MKSKVIALSAISAGLTVISLLVGAYLEIAELFALVVSSVFVILPLYLNSYKGSVLSYLAGGVIAFLCSGFNIMSLVFPTYFAFFGLYPIVKCKMVEKSFNKYVGYVLGLVWFLLVSFGAYFYYTLIMQGIFEGLPEWILDYIIYIVGAVAIVFFIIYDRFVVVCKMLCDRYLGRFIK